MQSLQTRLWAVLAFFVGVLALGAVGYRLVEGWSWSDALYMTAITATAVGFHEVHPMGGGGRLVTLGVLAGGLLGLGFWWALLTALIVDWDVLGMWRRRRMGKGLATLSGHHIVCGAGRMGRVIEEEVRRSGGRCVLVEGDLDVVSRLREEYPDLYVVHGDATREQVLSEVGIQRSRGLAACLRHDGDNLLLCLTARGLHPRIPVVARALEEESIGKLRRAGATHVISPTLMGALQMATSMIKPAVAHFLDAASLRSEVAMRLEEVRVPDGSGLVEQSLREARIGQRVGLVVLALRRCEHGVEPIFNPSAETVIHAGDSLIVMGTGEQVAQLAAYADG